MKPRKSLGQNFLKNKKILNQIVDTGDIKKKDIRIFMHEENKKINIKSLI